MKIILNILALVTVALCEVPPPYPTRGFRPSPPFRLPTQVASSQIRQPQRTYGPPNVAAPQVSFPPVPQTQYGVPNQVPNLTPSLTSKQTIPGTSYGVPVTDNDGLSRNTLRILNNQLQNQNQPQVQYGAPDSRDIETLEQIRKLNLLLQSRQVNQPFQRGQQSGNSPQSQNFNRDIPNTQYLPQREASNFRAVGEQSGNANLNFLQSQNSNRNIAQPNVQYLPSREIANFQITSTEFDNPIRGNQNINQNLQQLSQPKLFLPVKEATNFKQDFQLSESNIPQRIIPSASNSNFAPRNNRLPQKGTTPNLFQSQTVQPPSQYVPSEQTTGRPNSGRTNNNQPIPQQNFNQRQPSSINDILSQPNLNSNGFRQTNQPNDFDIEPADVRKLEPKRNGNINRFQAQNVRPNKQNHNTGEGIEIATSRPGETYLVPSTTVRNVNRPLGRPNIPSTTTVAPNQDNDESPDEDEEAGAGGPNVAVATAVSGLPAGQGFYLLQGDGRLQRVVYQKLREPGDQENEYTANYLFQNIQADPNLIYSPLITIGK